MADTSLNENRLALLIWQTSNLWQSKVRHKLKESEITLNEYLILETIYLLKQENYGNMGCQNFIIRNFMV